MGAVLYLRFLINVGGPNIAAMREQKNMQRVHNEFALRYWRVTTHAYYMRWDLGR